MSLDLTVYTKRISDDQLTKIVERLNEFEMECEVHPNISFSTHSGFLPFKFRLTNPPFAILKEKQLLTGFELYIDDFDLTTEKEKFRPKQGLIDKILGKKQLEPSFATPEIEERIKDCKKSVSFIWHAADSFELRFALLASAIYSELTNGVCCYSADNVWYNNEGFVETTWQDIKDYETNLLKERDLVFHEFKSWEQDM